MTDLDRIKMNLLMNRYGLAYHNYYFGITRETEQFKEHEDNLIYFIQKMETKGYKEAHSEPYQ